MNDIDHTLLVMGIIYISFIIGQKIGKEKGINIGFEDGASQAVAAMVDSLQRQYGMNFKGEIHIKEDKGDSDEDGHS